MNRQSISRIQQVLPLVLLLWFAADRISAEEETTALPRPNPAQAAWQEAEMGVVFHYDLHVFDGKRYAQGRNRITPVSDYNLFNPEHLDTDQWIRAAKAMGARFALITATHETGFALYPSDVNPFCLKAVRWRDGKGDVVGEFVRSCRKYGLAPGVYLVKVEGLGTAKVCVR